MNLAKSIVAATFLAECRSETSCVSLLITDLNWVGLKARINDLPLSTKEHL